MLVEVWTCGGGEPAGTPGGKAAILNLLGDLCHQEETTVRDQAVASLNKIGATLSAKDVQTLVVPIALKLARTLEWFTPRVSACGLFALSFKAVADDASAAALRGELRETFKALGIDDAPMVRRSTAGRLAEFAEVLSESMVIEDLLPRELRALDYYASHRHSNREPFEPAGSVHPA